MYSKFPSPTSLAGSHKCQKCGKIYKHSSSLSKHLWEHTPEWEVTNKLSISKHQQVQLLEAASILVGMNDAPIKRRRDSHFKLERSPPSYYRSRFSDSSSPELESPPGSSPDHYPDYT